MLESALRADSPLLGFPNSNSQDPLRFPSSDYVRLLCDSVNKRASVATHYSTSSFDSSLDQDYVQSLYHASTTTNSSICTPLTPLSPSIPEGELGSRWSLASSIEDEPKKKEKKPRKKISKDLLVADGEPKRKRLTSFISRLSLGAGSLLSPSASISSFTSNNVPSPGVNGSNEHQLKSNPQSPTTPIDASAATRDRDSSHHASNPSVSSTSTSSSSSNSNPHEPPLGLGLGFGLEPIDERGRPPQTPPQSPSPPPVPPKDSPAHYAFKPPSKDLPPLAMAISPTTNDLEVTRSPRFITSPTPTPTPPTPTHAHKTAHIYTPPSSPTRSTALVSPPMSPISVVMDDSYTDDAYEADANVDELVFKTRNVRKGKGQILDPNLSSDDDDECSGEERPPTPPTPSSPMMFGRAPSPTPSEVSVLSAIDTGLGVGSNGVIRSGVEERRERLRIQETKKKERTRKAAENAEKKSLRNHEGDGVMMTLPLEERSLTPGDGMWKRTKSRMMGTATSGKRRTSQPKPKLRIKSKTPSIDTTNTSYSTSTSTSTPDTFTSGSMSRSVSRSTTNRGGNDDTESVRSLSTGVRMSPSASFISSSHYYPPPPEQYAYGPGHDFPAIGPSGVTLASATSTTSGWSTKLKMGKSMEKLTLNIHKSEGKSLRTRRSTMTGIRGLALKMGMVSGSGSPSTPTPAPTSTSPSLKTSASVASFASLAVPPSPISASASGFGSRSGSGSNLAPSMSSASNSVTALASASVSTLNSPISFSPSTGAGADTDKRPTLVLPPPPTIPPPVPPKESQAQLHRYPPLPLPLSPSASVPPRAAGPMSAINNKYPYPPLPSSSSTARSSPVAPILKKSTSTPMGLGTGLASRPMYTRPPVRAAVSTTAAATPYAPSSPSHTPRSTPITPSLAPSYMKSTWNLEESESDSEPERDSQLGAGEQEQDQGEEESELAYIAGGTSAGGRKRSGSVAARMESSYPQPPPPPPPTRPAPPAIPPLLPARVHPPHTQVLIEAKAAPWVTKTGPNGNHGDSDSDVDPGFVRPARRRGYSLGRRRQSVLVRDAF